MRRCFKKLRESEVQAEHWNTHITKIPCWSCLFNLRATINGMSKWRVTKMKRKSSLVTCVWQKCLNHIWFEIYIDANSYDTTVILSSLNWTWNNNDKQSEWQFFLLFCCEVLHISILQHFFCSLCQTNVFLLLWFLCLAWCSIAKSKR